MKLTACNGCGSTYRASGKVVNKVEVRIAALPGDEGEIGLAADTVIEGELCPPCQTILRNFVQEPQTDADAEASDDALDAIRPPARIAAVS